MEKNEKPKAAEAAREPEAIKPGVPVKVEGTTREEAAARVKDLRRRAHEQGLTEKEGGFIHKVRKDFRDPGIYVAELVFVKR